ncbi:expressed unknown protein [Seminavis robusta]|uniref:Uncharacterized protein n=1 Tax=Seminavis robusta TaxID=568900 RepID=A0A9N8F347_9STRA|nr:expressed unknown protein [Seminavis robusta]|eukprot:Sro2989_g341780.1 n/a (234) ;mRNA; f:6322-7023
MVVAPTITKVSSSVVASSNTTALSKLCQANLGILSQKLGLLDALTAKHDPATAKELFQTTCPLVQASVGQHFRHSLDHMELAASIAEKPGGRLPELHYDLRERGCASESDMDAATERIVNMIHQLEVIQLMDTSTTMTSTGDDDTSSSNTVMPKQQMPAQAFFMLAGDSDTEYALATSIGRELGFAAHHAIHHMALVKLIATQTWGLDATTDLPEGFGRAPSTINFDNTNTQQ